MQRILHQTAGGQSDLVGYGVKHQHNANACKYRHIQTARQIPTREMGRYIKNGCRRTSRIGINPMVKKKFQCVPYSVSCS